MNINNELHPRLEGYIRALKDDDIFVDLVWSRLAGYHDLRSMELVEKPRKQVKQEAQAVTIALKKLTGALSATGSSAPSTPALSRELEVVQAAYAAHSARLDGMSGRSTRMRALRTLAGSLLDVFDAYGVSAAALPCFIESAIVYTTPKADDQDAVSTRVIQQTCSEINATRT